MLVRRRRDRRLMRHHEDLDILALLPQQTRNGCRSESSHTGVDLIVEDGVERVCAWQRAVQRQQDARFFSA